jgi:hypothetical protein
MAASDNSVREPGSLALLILAVPVLLRRRQAPAVAYVRPRADLFVDGPGLRWGVPKQVHFFRKLAVHSPPGALRPAQCLFFVPPATFCIRN